MTSTLNDAEHTLSTFAAGLETSLRPTVCEFHGGLSVFMVGITFYALIKDHHYVAIDRFLHIDRELWG